MINISSGKFRMQLGFLLAWLSTNTLFVLIFLNLNKSRDEQISLTNSVDFFLHSTDRSLKDLRNDFNQSTAYIREFRQTASEECINRIKSSKADLKTYDPLFSFQISADSLTSTQNALHTIVNDRLLLLQAITKNSQQSGTLYAAAQ